MSHYEQKGEKGSMDCNFKQGLFITTQRFDMTLCTKCLYAKIFSIPVNDCASYERQSLSVLHRSCP